MGDAPEGGRQDGWLVVMGRTYAFGQTLVNA